MNISERESLSAVCVEGVTAPRPIPGMVDETASYWIQVHVTEFLDFLLVTPNIEIIESPLPELRERAS
jgi:hypothetical protein